jgi:hypothetical protein
MTEKIKMLVELDVTPAQALALEAMFDHWNQLSSWGSSRMVGFYADGDGNFHPRCVYSYSEDPMKFNEGKFNREELKEMAAFQNKEKDSKNFDFDPIAWNMRK